MIKCLGTVYRFHPLFVLMMVMSIVTGYFIELCTLFGIVVIHEMGHVAAAKSFGWRVTEVQLLPFGGVAVVEESGNTTAREELWVALAGPLQNVWMVGFAYVMGRMGGFDPVWWNYFMVANVMIGLFNLLPIMPLDGGKVLFALLSYVMSYHRAMVSCSWMSLFMSVVIILASVFQQGASGIQLNFLVIGLFLFYSNWYGYRHLPFQFMRFLMSREARYSSTITNGKLALPIIVGGNKKIADIMQLFMREKYHLIYVLNEHGLIAKVLPEQQLIQSYFRDKKQGCAVSELFM